MLVTVQEISRLVLFNIVGEGNETTVHIIIAIVNQAGRVMSHEHVDARKAMEGRLHLVLLEQMMAFRFVFPRTPKTAKGETSDLAGAQVQIHNLRRER